MSYGYMKYISSIVTMIVLLKISYSSCQFAEKELINSELYKAFLNDIINPSKQAKRTEDDNILNKMQNDQKNKRTAESSYERVIRNLRTNWEMPVNYLQERGYLTKSDPKIVSSSNDLSMDAYNLINGPLLNPSTFKNLYPIPNGPNTFQSMKTVRSDNVDREYENV